MKRFLNFKSNKTRKLSILLILSLLISIAFFSIQLKSKKLTGVYWGAFDPPTEAHAAIIRESLSTIPLKKLIIVINNHPYKNYTYSLERRLQMMTHILQEHDSKKVELLWQDEAHPLDFKALKKITQEPLCAIAGYDAYVKWVRYSTPHDRSCYDAIVVIPRGDVEPVLFDEVAFLLPIDAKYKDVSSTKVRISSRSKND